MKIILDAYGGDNAPLEIVKGARLAVDELGTSVILCGDERKLRVLADKEAISLDGMEILHAPVSMPVEAEPTSILKEYADSSIAAGFRLLAAGGGDAFVTAGSTGAAVVGGSMIVKRIKGIKRPALGTVIPTSGGGRYMLLDIGANSECRPEMLYQFALMGSVYMERILKTPSPRVGIVNIGTEETKGLELQIEAGKLLNASGLNFIGNVEARELPLNGCDVAVADGFTGNIILKLTEGMGKMMSNELKTMLFAGLKTKLAALLLRQSLVDFKKRLDYTEYGGAPLMGTSKPVIKAHGSSNAKAIKNAIRQAILYSEAKVTDEIQSALKNE